MQRVWSMTLAHFTAPVLWFFEHESSGFRIWQSELYHAKKERKHVQLVGDGLPGLTNAQGHKKLALVNL